MITELLRRHAKTLLPLVRAVGPSLVAPTPLRSFVALPAAQQQALVDLAEHQSALVQRGWFASYAARAPVDAIGQPIPWFVYASIDFLEARVRSDMSVLEFGAGHSTLWWAARAARVKSFESDRDWFERISRRLPPNAELRLSDTHSLEEIEQRILPGVAQHDVVVIDGGERNALLRHAPRLCTPHGVVILDNSDRDEYRPGIEALQAAGFRQIPFRGEGPINTYAWSTTVFYRSDNCFGI